MRASMPYNPSSYASGGRVAIRGSNPPPQSSDSAAVTYHNAAAAAAAAAAGLPYPPLPVAASTLMQRSDAGRQPGAAVQGAQDAGHVATSVYPAQTTSSSPPPSQPNLPPGTQRQQGNGHTQQQQQQAIGEGEVEAPDSPLRGVVLHSATASPAAAAATAAAAAGTLAAAEAWLAATSDPDGAPGGSAAESFHDITLMPRRHVSTTEPTVGGSPPADSEAVQLPPTPTAASGATGAAVGVGTEAYFRAAAGGTVAALMGADPALRLQVPSPQQRLSDSLQGPLPGGSSPKPRAGWPQPPLVVSRAASQGASLFISATGLQRSAQYPTAYGSVMQRPATAAAAVPQPAAAAAAGGGRPADVLTVFSPPHGSMSRLEGDPSYVHYPNLMAKGEFSGSVPHMHSKAGFSPSESQAGPSWRSYIMRSRASGVGTTGAVRRSGADWFRGSVAASAASRNSMARASAAVSSMNDQSGQSHVRQFNGADPSTRQGIVATSLSKHGLWESRAALAAEGRGMRAAARLIRAENRRLAGEVAALENSVEGLAEGMLSPDFVRLHAESVERRLTFAQQFGPLLSARGSSRSYQDRDMTGYATEAEAVAAAAAEAAAAAAAEVYEDDDDTATAAAADGLLPSYPMPERPSSAPSASNEAAAAPTVVSTLGWGSGGGTVDYGRGQGVYGSGVYGSTTKSQSQFRYVPPAELRLRRDVLTELQLRQSLSDTIKDSHEAALNLLVPQGADADEILKLVQAVRQEGEQQPQRQERQQSQGSSQQGSGSSPQEPHDARGGDGGSGAAPPPHPPAATPAAAQLHAQRRVSFAVGTRGGEDTVNSVPAAVERLPPTLPRSSPGREAAAVAALAAAAAVAAPRQAPLATSAAPPGPSDVNMTDTRHQEQHDDRDEGGDDGGEEQDGGGAGEVEPRADAAPQRRRLTDAVIRVLNARAAGELMYPRPPAPDPFGELDQDTDKMPETSPSGVRAFAILAAMGGTKMDVRKLGHDPRVSAVDQLLAPPASSLLALLYLSSRRAVPHTDDFLGDTDLEYVSTGGDAEARGGEGGGRQPVSGPAPGEPTTGSPLSGQPPAGDLFMDFNSPRRAPYGQTYRHVEAWSVRDAGLVLERQAREMELAGRYRIPAAYVEADTALKQRLNLDDPDLEERADELRDQMRQEEYEERLHQAGEELRERERERYGYV